MPTVSVAGVTRASIATQPINAQTGTAYTVAATDVGKLVTCTNAATVTVTLPPDLVVAVPVGGRIDFVGLGAGLIEFAAGLGVDTDPDATVHGTPTTDARAQYSHVWAIKIAADTWLVAGDLAAA